MQQIVYSVLKEACAARAVSQGEGLCDHISEQSCSESVRIG